MNLHTQYQLNYANDLRIDLFAGGGGASTGTEMATGKPVDIAVNHSENAISMHRLNHPHTQHFTCDVYEVKPHQVTNGRRVAHLHASPDCTHHSQAAGGQPRSSASRSLSWVIAMWAGQAAPTMITMENVKQIRNWGPLIAKRCKTTGRVIKRDGKTVAAPGERVPVSDQFLVPDPKRKGQTWRAFLKHLQSLGYQVEHKLLRACDYGAATTRERLFLVARRDGLPICWPEPTHFEHPKRGQKRWPAAADHIDFTLPSKSIFDRPRPLADATMRRIAKGIHRFVLDTAQPFIVPIANWSTENLHPVSDPLRTITAQPKGGTFAVAAPTLVKFRADHIGQRLDEPLPTITSGGGSKRPAGAPHAMGIASAALIPFYGEKSKTESRSSSLEKPLKTQTTENRHGLATAFMAQMNGGNNTTPGHELTKPASTIVGKGSTQQLVTANMVTLRQNCSSQAADAPLPAITAAGQHHALVQCTLSPEVIEEKALRVAAFLMSYYGTDNISAADAPLPTITTKDRLALVTVVYQGATYVIIDITLRMLQPKELYGCQGFPSNYNFERGHDGRTFSKSEQVKMVGNSVSPYPQCALLKVNSHDQQLMQGVAA
ncbi:DNA cytosine methyltransferase [Pseudomonas neustonica]|uniref:DNA (cytosine-5-)-methyltransferase n=1 Tax=Pseudomonas neustonica TaxID=2487346 RepID=A0ABX9XEP8_9PSED|nr:MULTISPECIES: DNA cytosine methyltransferase [Pseudomonas]ROZ80928.1 DNA cytosine methyltransferase [Pseudomonas sp. SSM44]ROZ82126.1 DNA cytosine methyltransferase [Pseudomonas neustonica]